MRLTGILLSFFAIASLQAAMLDEVPSDQLDELKAGQIVVTSQNVQGAPWPRLQLYKIVDAPPKVINNLFTDYASAPDYTPNMIAAKVIADNPDGTKDVQYTVKVPILQKASYTVQNTYIQKGNNYTVQWKLLKSPLAKVSDGSLRVVPYPGGKSLMCYTNLCIPITNLVAGLKNQALNEAKSTVTAIAAEAEKRAAAQ